MIGQPIESRREGPAKAVVFLLLAAGLVAGGVIQNSTHFYLGAILPFLLGVALFWMRRPGVVFTFTEQGIEIESANDEITYEAIETVIAPKRPGDPDKDGPRHYPIHLVHEDGTFHIPARLNVPSDDVFRFLLETFPQSGSAKVNAQLTPYLAEQRERFGADRVFSFRARRFLGKAPPSKATAVSLAIMLAGILWAVIGFSLNDQVPKKPARGGMPAQESEFIVWGGLGLMLGIFGALFAFLFWLISRRNGPPLPLKGWDSASLVIGPLGLALVQGDMKGEMVWDELEELKFSLTGSLRTGSQPGGRGILLKFAGAGVVILDIYDRPLNLIYKQLLGYWKPDRR